MKDSKQLLVAHVVYRFDVGGLENGVVNLINCMPREFFRHAVVALTQCVPGFCARVEQPGVEFISLDKPPGHGIWQYAKLYRVFRALQPDVVHTRNLAALEAMVPAWAAGVPRRVHGEHGWDADDPDGSRMSFRLVRRAYRPFVDRYVALSGHIAGYLMDSVGVPPERIGRICNGVDTVRFHPAHDGRERLEGAPEMADDTIVIGTVGRLQAVKNQVALVHAVAQLIARNIPGADRIRLVVAGDGPLRSTLEEEIARCGIGGRAWLAGERNDVPAVMRSLDIFALPSLGEGISNTVLEAMASGLPVVATDVGGNGELVDQGRTGLLVPAGDDVALANALAPYVLHAELRERHGRAGRVRVESEFSLDGMVDRYVALYRDLVETSAPSRAYA